MLAGADAVGAGAGPAPGGWRERQSDCGALLHGNPAGLRIEHFWLRCTARRGVVAGRFRIVDESLWALNEWEDSLLSAMGRWRQTSN